MGEGLVMTLDNEAHSDELDIAISLPKACCNLGDAHGRSFFRTRHRDA